MQATLIENDGRGRISYDSLVLNDPKLFSVFNSKIALKIVKTLAEAPMSAIDISRKLRIHEQKIYYHVRKLEKAGIIYTVSNEKRYGMIAKIYSVVSPVVAAKLYERGTEVKENFTANVPSNVFNFFSPFVSSGRLESRIVVGDPLPHGQHSEGSRESPFVTDFILFLGTLVNEMKFPSFLLDVEVKETDLKNNLILIGNPRTNTVIERFFEHIPIKFDLTREIITSEATKKEYKGPFVGYIIKFNNPYNKNKKVLLLGGLRSRGSRSAAIAITQHFTKTFLNLSNGDSVIRIVEGVDKDSDKIIDDIKILE